MSKRTLFLSASLFFSLTLVIFGIPQRAFGDGILIPPPDIPVREAFAVRYHRVKVSVDDNVVRTEIDQAFENLTGRRIEADYVFPIPPDAFLENFAMWVNGKKVTGSVLPANEARQIYEEIVRKQRDPALLEYIGNNAFRARVFPIEPGEKKRIQLSYTQLIKADNGIYEYVYPLNTEKFSAQLIDEVTVSGSIETSVPIKTIYSPSHTINVSRKDDTHASFSYEESNVRPDIDFILYYSVDAREIGASLLAYGADDNEDGFFVATITPRVESEQTKVINKNFIFVLDKSGSMADDGKIDQAKRALKFVLQSLNKGDRFNVIAYSDEVWVCFSAGMKTWTQESRDKALSFVKQFEAVGGTNINDALLRALAMLKEERGERPSYIVFLTDGLPTVGVTGESEIINNVSAANSLGARLFALGVGYDVNTHLLDKLSGANHGITEYVRPNEDIEVKVSSLYSKISSPVLTNVRIQFDGVRVTETYPSEMPDLFKGNQVIIAGRFKLTSGDPSVILSGKVDGKPKQFSFPVSFTSRSYHSFVPRVWAGRKIGYLTDEIRLNGPNDELIKEIVRLSKRYGIITAYTSFLIREDNMLFAPEEELRDKAKLTGDSLRETKTGAGAVGQSQTSQNLKGETTGGQGGANAPGMFYDEAGNEVRVESIKYIGDLTFFLVDNYWTDSRFDPDKFKLVEVKAFSPAYFELVSGAKLGKFLALGDQLTIVMNEKTALRISLDQGKDKLTDAELEKIIKAVEAQSS